jgi:hypothetical protein
MNIEAMKEDLRALEAQIKELNQKRHDLRHKITNAQSEFKVGDFVTNGKANAVWMITSINPGYGYSPRYFGKKLKKNGEPGARINEIWQFDGGLRLVEKE